MTVTITEKDIQRFWSKVDKSGGEDACWLWQAWKNNKGYGMFCFRRDMLASRFSWMLMYGDIPSKMEICHKCDNPSCVNPHHLFLGTHKENFLDMVNKGRSPKGERNGQAKLTAEQVKEIRRLYKAGNTSCLKLAHQFGVSYQQIWLIISNKKWKGISE